MNRHQLLSALQRHTLLLISLKALEPELFRDIRAEIKTWPTRRLRREWAFARTVTRVEPAKAYMVRGGRYRRLMALRGTYEQMHPTA